MAVRPHAGGLAVGRLARALGAAAWGALTALALGVAGSALLAAPLLVPGVGDAARLVFSWERQQVRAERVLPPPPGATVSATSTARAPDDPAERECVSYRDVSAFGAAAHYRAALADRGWLGSEDAGDDRSTRAVLRGRVGADGPLLLVKVSEFGNLGASVSVCSSDFAEAERRADRRR